MNSWQLGLLALLALALPASGAAQTYKATDLGTFGGPTTYGLAINNAGQVAGYGNDTTEAGVTHAFLWNEGALTDLGGSWARAYGINNVGQVVGQSQLPDPSGNLGNHATLWTNGTITDITQGTAYAINDIGQVVGSYFVLNSNQNVQAFAYSGGTLVKLGSLDGVAGSSGSARGINNAGQIVGASHPAGGDIPDIRPTLWSGGAVIDLGTLGGLNGLAHAINGNGQIVGYSSTSTGSTHATLWSNNTITDLGASLGISNRSEAYAVNTSGQIVGYGVFPSAAGERHAALWIDGKPLDLNNLLDPLTPISPYKLAEARGINDNGLIVAIGSYGNSTHAYLLTPVVITLTVTPSSLSFGNSAVGTSTAAQSITATNAGTSPVGFGVSTTGDYSQTNNCVMPLAANASCTMQVTFTPTAPGTRTGVLTVSSGGTAFSASLTGVGTFSASLTASATTVLVGTPVTLTWASASGATCTATGGSPGDGWTGTLAASGSKAVAESASGSYTYGVTCTGGGQSSQSQVTVSMGLPTVSLSAVPTTVMVGQAAVLTWSSTFATACIASGGGSGDGWTGPKALSGTMSVTQSAAAIYTYTLVCSAGSQSVQAQAFVIVNRPPKSGGGGGAIDGWAWVCLGGLAFAKRRKPHLATC